MTYRRGLKLTPHEKPGDHATRTRGEVANLMASNARYRAFPIVSLSVWIDPAIMTNQLAIFYDSYSGNPVGYITWAFLAPDVEHRWLKDPNVLLHDSEWNEGGNLWIMDFLAIPGYCEDIIEFIEQNMFSDQSQAFSLRRNDDGRVRKVSCWKRRKTRSPACSTVRRV
jgi:cytolysin-activating lysine-acyltransferase